MYVFFLGVVPFVSLFLFFVYYWRQNRPAFLRKSANVYVQTRYPNGGGVDKFNRDRRTDMTIVHKPNLTIGDSKLISCTNPRVINDSHDIVLSDNGQM